MNIKNTDNLDVDHDKIQLLIILNENLKYLHGYTKHINKHFTRVLMFYLIFLSNKEFFIDIASASFEYLWNPVLECKNKLVYLRLSKLQDAAIK